MAAIGPVQIAAKLEVIGRISKHQINAVIGQAFHSGNAIARQNLAQRQSVFWPDYWRRSRLYFERAALLCGLNDPHHTFPNVRLIHRVSPCGQSVKGFALTKHG